MELSRPPLVVAFELSEKRKAIVADALASAGWLLPELAHRTETLVTDTFDDRPNWKNGLVVVRATPYAGRSHIFIHRTKVLPRQCGIVAARR
jgi:hypothetical protein